MTEIKFTKEQLEKRLDAIREQLKKVNSAERIELDNDMEDQAIQVEQSEVAVTMEKNLQTEMTMIEEKLREMNDE